MGDCVPEGAYGLYGRRGMYGFAVRKSCFFSSNEKCSIVKYTLTDEFRPPQRVMYYGVPAGYTLMNEVYLPQRGSAAGGIHFRKLS